MAIITNTTSTNNNAATNVRQLGCYDSSKNGREAMKGFFNISSSVTVELDDLGNWLTQNQSKMTWEAGLTQKGKTQYTAKAGNTTIGWYQPGQTQGMPGTLTFSARRELNSTSDLDNLF